MELGNRNESNFSSAGSLVEMYFSKDCFAGAEALGSISEPVASSHNDNKSQHICICLINVDKNLLKIFIKKNRSNNLPNMFPLTEDLCDLVDPLF